jgi:thiamine transport system substrate-binding protein
LTLTPGWNAAYGLFLKKEAPFVWSYLTSQAYHSEMAREIARETDGKTGKPLPRYQAVLFKEGQPFQVEGAALIKGDAHSKESQILARKFLEFLISPEVQKMVPKKAWMMPVLKGIEVPDSFRDLPLPLRLVQTQTDPTEMTKLLSRWKEIVGRSF